MLLTWYINIRYSRARMSECLQRTLKFCAFTAPPRMTNEQAMVTGWSNLQNCGGDNNAKELTLMRSESLLQKLKDFTPQEQCYLPSKKPALLENQQQRLGVGKQWELFVKEHSTRPWKPPGYLPSPTCRLLEEPLSGRFLISVIKQKELWKFGETPGSLLKVPSCSECTAQGFWFSPSFPYHSPSQ